MKFMNTVLACDGLHGGGCPHGSSYVAEVRNYRLAREEAHLFGWKVRTVQEEGEKRRWIDVCRECSQGV